MKKERQNKIEYQKKLAKRKAFEIEDEKNKKLLIFLNKKKIVIFRVFFNELKSESSFVQKRMNKAIDYYKNIKKNQIFKEFLKNFIENFEKNIESYNFHKKYILKNIFLTWKFEIKEKKINEIIRQFRMIFHARKFFLGWKLFKFNK